MKLLHVVPTYVPAYRHGGPIVAVHGLCRALAARGHDVTVLTTDVDGDGRLDVPLARPVARDGVTVWYFPVRWPRRLYVARGLRAALERLLPEIDLVHLHSVFLWPTSAAARAAHRRGIPYVVAPRGMLVPELLRRRGRWRKALWLRLVERRTLREAAALHCTSALEATEAARCGLALPEIALVPNGVDPVDASGAAPSPVVAALLARRPLLLALGRLNWKKGLERLLDMLPLVPDATLALAGPDEDGEQARLSERARALGIAARVAFPGEVHGDDKRALLAGCDVFLMPSLSENFGNSGLEAMAAGRPVVVTPAVGLAAELTESTSGVVAEGTPKALAAACNRLLGDTGAAAALGARARAVVEARYTWSRIAERMEAVYAPIVARRTGGVAGA